MEKLNNNSHGKSLTILGEILYFRIERTSGYRNVYRIQYFYRSVVESAREGQEVILMESVAILK